MGYEMESGGSDGTDMMYKQGIWCLMKLIYEEFHDKLPIGRMCKNQLQTYFESDESETLAGIRNYEDMMGVFHQSVSECWCLLFFAHQYRFGEYALAKAVRDGPELAEP